ncbi:MAG: hypothetical protein Q4G03_07445 [Planctomycetia bacterium]|nr:hypothetical protein [Planctomycetia bacterium]
MTKEEKENARYYARQIQTELVDVAYDMGNLAFYSCDYRAIGRGFTSKIALKYGPQGDNLETGAEAVAFLATIRDGDEEAAEYLRTRAGFLYLVAILQALEKWIETERKREGGRLLWPLNQINGSLRNLRRALYHFQQVRTHKETHYDHF